MKVEVTVLGSPSLITLHGLCGRKATLNLPLPEFRSFVRKSRWTSWAPVPNKPTVSVDVKQHFSNTNISAKHTVY